MIETANSGIKTFQDILTLKQEMDGLIIHFGKKAHNASKLVEFLYQRPIISISDIIEPLNISKPTANTLVKEFEAKGILKEKRDMK
jgi:DNA-binding MarR family transcriptional regulator